MHDGVRYTCYTLSSERGGRIINGSGQLRSIPAILGQVHCLHLLPGTLASMRLTSGYPGPSSVSVPAIRMQLDRKNQPHAFYMVRVEMSDGSVQAGWKRWSECRQFAYAMMLQTVDAPRFPSHKFISVCSSDAFRLVSNRCLDPEYLERRRNSLETYFRLVYAEAPVAVVRFLDTGAGAESPRSSAREMPARRSIDRTWSPETWSPGLGVPRPERPAAAAPAAPAASAAGPAPAEERARRALRYDVVPAGERPSRGSRGRRGVHFTKGERSGGRGMCKGVS